MFDFNGKWVLVTGGTSGIGSAIARSFSLAKANVISVGLASNESAPESIRTEILDVTDTAAVDRLIGSLPKLDVVVNAAGIIRRDKEFDLDVFAQVLDVNLVGAMRV